MRQPDDPPPGMPPGASHGASSGAAPAYVLLLAPLVAASDELARRVAADVAGIADPPADEVEASLGAVRWLLDALARGPVPAPAQLRPLREAAAAQARAGGAVQVVLDRALSAGWVVWAAATGSARASGAELAALGEALLRTGDAAAAAIANAFAVTERELALRSGAAMRSLLDRLLDLPDGDADARARLVARLAEEGIAADLPVTVVLADAGRDLADGDPAVADAARAASAGRSAPSGAPVADPRALAGPSPIPVVGTTRGRLVLLAPSGRRGVDPLPGLRGLGAGWVAVAAEAGSLPAVGAALREAAAALVVARRLGLRDRVTPARDLRLERALLAQPGLLAEAVAGELGPLRAAPRGGALVATLAAWFAERENTRAAARHLGIAPRTVAYRLARIERLLGGPLDADRRLRLATALFATRLVEPPVVPAGPATDRPRPAGHAADRPRPARRRATSP